jgi:hypothetical protein
MRVELDAPNGEKVQLGVRFHYLAQVTVTEEMLKSIANGPKLFGESEKHFREDVVGEKRDVVRCAIESIHNDNGKIQTEEMISGFAVCHQIEGFQKLVGRKTAFARAIHELTRLSVPLCSLNGGPKEVRRKLWAAFLDNVKVLGYRKPVVEEAVATGA